MVGAARHGPTGARNPTRSGAFVSAFPSPRRVDPPGGASHSPGTRELRGVPAPREGRRRVFDPAFDHLRGACEVVRRPGSSCSCPIGKDLQRVVVTPPATTRCGGRIVENRSRRKRDDSTACRNQCHKTKPKQGLASTCGLGPYSTTSGVDLGREPLHIGLSAGERLIPATKPTHSQALQGVPPPRRRHNRGAWPHNAAARAIIA